MNQKLTKKDVEILDSILNGLMEKGKLYPDDLKPISNTPISDLPSSLAYDYQDYFDIIKELSVARVALLLDGHFVIESIPAKTERFFLNGGFKSLYDEQEKEKKARNIGYKNQRWGFAKNIVWFFGFIISITFNLLFILGVINSPDSTKILKEQLEEYKIEKTNENPKIVLDSIAQASIPKY